jgi:hypothetical protein
MSIGIFYLCLLLLGLLYALLSGVLGWFADLGHGEIQFDSGGHLEAGSPHPISGTTVATFVTGFGAGGVVAHYGLKWELLAGLGLALVSGFAVAAAAFGVLELIFKQTQAGSEFDVQEMVGREVEVITPIPAGGMGEIACSAKGQREVAAARSIDGSAIGKGRLAVIEKVTASTVYVRVKK